MGSYKILFKRSAEKELRDIPSPFLSRVLSKVDSLSANPRPSGVQMLKGPERYYRIRQGDYRIIFEINAEERAIVIIKIGHRREIYDRS